MFAPVLLLLLLTSTVTDFQNHERRILELERRFEELKRQIREVCDGSYDQCDGVALDEVEGPEKGPGRALPDELMVPQIVDHGGRPEAPLPHKESPKARPVAYVSKRCDGMQVPVESSTPLKPSRKKKKKAVPEATPWKRPYRFIRSDTRSARAPVRERPTPRPNS